MDYARALPNKANANKELNFAAMARVTTGTHPQASPSMPSMRGHRAKPRSHTDPRLSKPSPPPTGTLNHPDYALMTSHVTRDPRPVLQENQARISLRITLLSWRVHPQVASNYQRSEVCVTHGNRSSQPEADVHHALFHCSCETTRPFHG